MKKRILNFLTITLTLLTVSCSSSKPPKELSNIAVLKSPTSTKISPMRLENLKRTARSVAAQASLSWRSRQINEMLEHQKRQLDQIFNFNYLILNQNILPPILVEGRNALNLADDFTIRVSDIDYQIVKAPRFITTPPNWRNYIWMVYKKPETPHSTLLPQNASERKIWNEYIQIGWSDGIFQADQIFAANLARLKRDYEGMILYRKLLAQNMVTPPYTAQADLGITGDGNNLHINDRVLRITAISQLQINPQKWKPIIPTKNQPHKILQVNNKKEKIN
ncbi:MAG: type IV secretion system DotC family protein [Coxiellaceae bacterium]|jgi:defect-in-organelle-trafficking protein DotC|nr:type IV secretion system DotC family protein [Coxiellaceae bacterium]